MVSISPGVNCGGLLTMAAVLAMNSTGVDSNPLKRGGWLLERMLHDPPPLPPPNVPEVDLTDTRILKMPRRNGWRIIGTRPPANRVMPRLIRGGLALENFDAVGLFRGG